MFIILSDIFHVEVMKTILKALAISVISVNYKETHLL
jgi:hypothetical protein